MAVQANLDSSGLTSNSSLLGPSSVNLGGPGALTPKSAKPAAEALDDVALKSGMNVDYSTLKNLLKEGKWREAEDETRAKLIEAAGPGAAKAGCSKIASKSLVPRKQLVKGKCPLGASAV